MALTWWRGDSRRRGLRGGLVWRYYSQDWYRSDSPELYMFGLGDFRVAPSQTSFWCYLMAGTVRKAVC